MIIWKYNLLITLSVLIANCVSLYPQNSDIVELTSNNFEKLVIQNEEIWIVEFFAPWCGHCQNLVPEIIKLASALKGIIKVGALNADKYKELARKYGIKGLPTIFIFGSNKYQPMDYDGIRTATKIAEKALQIAKEKANKLLIESQTTVNTNENIKEKLYEEAINIIELNDVNFDKLVLKSDESWLINFFAPWCGHCKTFAPLWVKISNELQDKMKIGIVEATTHKRLANKYNIEKYPTLKFFPPRAQHPPIDYEGEHVTDSIIQWSLEKMVEYLPEPKMIQIIDANSFDVLCTKKTVCILAVLPHIYDCQSVCRNDYLNMLENLGKHFKQTLWGWGWTEAGTQPHLEEALGIGGFGYPALAAINSKKRTYSLFMGGFSRKPLYEFLRELAYGKRRSNFFKNRETLDILEVEKWNGKDANPPEEKDIEYVTPKEEL